MLLNALQPSDSMPDDAVSVPEKGFHKLSKDPCYAYYEESLKCLDRNNYSHDRCGEAFQAFKDCRARQGSRDAEERAAVLKQDPLLGWLARWYSGKLEEYRQQTAGLAAQQQPVEEELPEWKRAALAKEAEQQQQQQQQQHLEQERQQQHQAAQQTSQQQQQQPDQVQEPGQQRRSWWRRGQ